MATPRLEMLPNREPLSRSKNSNIRATIAISLGAISGCLSRYYLGLWLTQSINTGFPLGTLVVNISGCFFIGIITTIAGDYSLLNPDLVLLITTGFLGAYTTFSSYELDTANLLEAKNLQSHKSLEVFKPPQFIGGLENLVYDQTQLVYLTTLKRLSHPLSACQLKALRL